MKRADLIQSLAFLENYKVVPASFYEEINKKKNGGLSASKVKADKKKKVYSVDTDRRFRKLFNAPSAKYLMNGMAFRAFAIAIFAQLSSHGISEPTQEQLRTMLSLSGKTIDELRDFSRRAGFQVTIVPSRRLAPVVIILASALYDAMICSAAQKPVGEKKRRPTSSQQSNPDEEMHRLKRLVDYMREEGLLFLSTDEIVTDILANELGIETAAKVVKAFPEYEHFIKAESAIFLKNMAINAELDEMFQKLEDCIKTLNYRRQTILEQRLKIIVRSVEKGNPRPRNFAAPQQPLPLTQRSNIQSILEDSSDMAAEEIRAILWLCREEGRLPDNAEADRIDQCVVLTLPPELRSRYDQIIQDIEEISIHCDEIVEAADQLRDQICKDKDTLIQHSFNYAIAEGFLNAFLNGEEEIHRLDLFTCLILEFIYLTHLPIHVVPFEPMEDEEEWDSLCQETNGKLGLKIYDSKDLMPVQLMREGSSSSIRLSLPTVLAQYAHVPVYHQLYIRKSHIKLFKDGGFSDRRARDFAIVLATIENMTILDSAAYRFSPEDPFEHLEDNTATPIETAAPVLQKDQLQLALEEANRQIKQAQKESQLCRHENAQLQRENERLKKRLAELTTSITPQEQMPASTTAAKPEITFPYHTKKKVIVYGGFEVFHKELQKLLPEVRIVEHTAHIDVAPIRGADLVCMQINKTSHSGYWTVRDTCKASGVPYVHLNYASARRCAEVIVEELEKLDVKTAP